MSVLFLLPGLISLILVIRGKIETAFLSVYLPALILLPDGYACRFPHLPAISAAEAALIPIGVVCIKRMLTSGLPNILDILTLLFLISTSISEVTHERVMNDGILTAITSCVSIGMAYVVGRRMIEPGLRLATVKRIVLLMLLLGPVGLVEWRLAQNLYGVYGYRLFGVIGVQANVQLRAGHGRMSASFNDAELAGIVFAVTAALNVWLVYLRKWNVAPNLGRRFTWLEKMHIPGILLLLYVYLTQSRGPMIAAAVGYLILQIPKFKSKKTAMVVVGVAIIVGGFAAMQYLQRYTNVSDPSAVKNEQQGSAIYRRQMNELYAPIVKQGGLFGWSMLSHPILPGMFSIDNEFLLVHLAYGDAGYILFVLIAAESLRRAIVKSWMMRGREDQAFATSITAALVIFWISISTVYMGEQVPQIAFLLMGWGQSLTPSQAVAASEQEAAPRTAFAFNRVFQ